MMALGLRWVVGTAPLVPRKVTRIDPDWEGERERGVGIRRRDQCYHP